MATHRTVSALVHRTDHAAHVSYFGAAALGFHEAYGYAAGVLLVVFVFNLVIGAGEEG
jgi:hypothetical protein